MTTATQFVEVNGTHLHVQETGAGRAVVFIHGATGNLNGWEPQVAAFAEHFRVVRYDLRGYGQSDVPTEAPYSHADDLKALLDHQSIDRVAVVGLSLGGRIAIDFATAYPDSVWALVPVGARMSGVPMDPDMTALLMQITAAFHQDGLEAAREIWFASPVFAGVRRRPAVAETMRGIVSAYSGWHLRNVDPEQELDPPAAQRLAEIGAPTLAVVGAEELPGNMAVADLLVQQVPGARKHVIANAGHISNMEEPEAFNAAVLAFLQGL